MEQQPALNDSHKTKIEFLYKAIEDSQSVIRFTDSKAGAVIGLWIALFTILSRTNVDMSKFLFNGGLFDVSIVLVLGFYSISCVIKSIWLAFMTVLPKTSPTEHINTDLENAPEELFYIHSVVPRLTGKFLFFTFKEPKLEITTKRYSEVFDQLDEQDLKKILIYELQKTSFIRNTKIARITESVGSLQKFFLTIVVFLFYKFGLYLDLHYYWRLIMNQYFVNVSLFISMFVGHLVGDYLFQTEKEAVNKTQSPLYLLKHSFVYSVIVTCFAFLVLGYFKWQLSFILFITHVLLDHRIFIKTWCRVIKGVGDIEDLRNSRIVEKVDQSFHLLIIFLLSIYR